MPRTLSDSDFDHEDVRVLAYRLWEDDGRPEDRAEEFWFRALDQLSGRQDEEGAETPAQVRLSKGSQI